MTMATYTLQPQIPLSNPTATTIKMAALSVSFGDKTVTYPERTFTIPAPSEPTWYFVIISRETVTVTCSITDDLVGADGHVYVGAIQATPAGGSDNAIAGGWPTPTTFKVGD